MSIDVEAYKLVMKIKETKDELGGQELIYGEIIGACSGYRTVHLPLICSSILQRTFLKNGFLLKHGNQNHFQKADVLYFGTPTIVNDRALFYPELFPEWNKIHEREYVKSICKKAVEAGFSKIISGLGSGDISVGERLNDMGGGKVICYKDFGEFKDWVLEREL